MLHPEANGPFSALQTQTPCDTVAAPSSSFPGLYNEQTGTAAGV
jgi:hypothetical protein